MRSIFRAAVAMLLLFGGAAAETPNVESWNTVDLGDFNVHVREAALGGAGWVHDPIRVALEFLDSRGSYRVTIERQDERGEVPRETVVTIVESGYLDDSVEGRWIECRLARGEHPIWTLTEVRQAYRCQRGERRDSYGKDPCP